VSRVRLWGQIDAFPVCFPLRTDRLKAVVVQFAVPAPAARPLLPGRCFELVEAAGKAHLVVTGLEFEGNTRQIGRRISLAFIVRPACDPAAPPGAFQWRSLVNQRFDREMGYRVFGIASTVVDLSVSFGAGPVTLEVQGEVTGDRGEPALRVRLPETPLGAAGVPMSAPIYTCRDGVAQRIQCEMSALRGVVSDTSAVDVSVGSGPLADALRLLGLPRAPERCLWGERLSATFDATSPV
jgi:hypothetical protein